MVIVCSICGTEAYYDGRCGDGPILTCSCANGEWVDDGRGGYVVTNAKAVKTADTMTITNNGIVKIIIVKN